MLRNGTVLQVRVLHLGSFCLADADLHLAGADDSALAALKAQYADSLGRACRRSAAWLETGGAPMRPAW